MAMANGADAVYIGGKEFSARASAVNFSRQEIEEAVDFAHIRGKKVFVTLNILLAQDEIKEALEYTNFLWQVGVDALIVQDIGFAQLVRKLFPDFELHASTQMSILDFEGAKYLERLGFTRIVVGREIELSEIKKIKEYSNLEIEAFCHGALCVSVSGQCLMSSMIGGRSGNRGACAQPCRKQYTIVDSNLESVYEKGYAISPKDLNTIEDVHDLLLAGVYSFKLEGRMKRPDYVGVLTKNYAQALKKESYNQEHVKQIFNRTFTKGFTFGEFSRDYISFDRPDNRGVCAGQALRRIGKNTQIKSQVKLSKGDLLEFQAHDGSLKTFLVNEDIPKGKEVTLALNFRPKIPSSFSRVISQELKEVAEESLGQLYQIEGLRGKIYIHINEKPVFTLVGKYEVSIEGEDLVEEAAKNPLDKDRIRENLSKFDKSYFYLQDLSFDVDSNAFIPIRTVNELRRNALEAYEAFYQFKRSEKEINLPKQSYEIDVEERKISVEVMSLNQLKRVDLSKVDRVELAFSQDIDLAFDYLSKANIQVYLSLPFYDKEKNYQGLLDKYSNKVHGVLIQSLGQLETLPKDMEILIGESLNIFNHEAAKFYLEKKYNIIPSPECTISQLQEFTKAFGSCGEIYVYGYQKVMEMKHCPLSLKKNCGEDRNCKTCNFRKGYSLLDAREAKFAFLRNYDFTEVYNSVPTYLGNDIREIQKLNPSMYKIKIRFDEEEIEEIIDSFYSYFKGDKEKIEELNDKFRLKGFTRGHLRKGILV